MTEGVAPVPPLRWKRIFCEVWAGAYAVGLFFALLQMILMSDRWWLLAPTLLAPPALYLGLRALFRAHLRRRIPATVVVLLIASAHLILPIRQLAGTAEPTVDSVILAFLSLLLFLT